MRNLTANICLIIAVLLGNGIATSSRGASETIQSPFANVILNFPYPYGLCLLGNSAAENKMWKWTATTQKEAKNKLLAIWVECNERHQLAEGNIKQLTSWVILVAFDNNGPEEKAIFPKMTHEQFRKQMLELLGNVVLKPEEVNSALHAANKELFGSETHKQFGDIIELGTLAVTESIHAGKIINSKTEGKRDSTVANVSTSMLVQGVVVHAYHYKLYKNEQTIKDMLSKAKAYSLKVFYLNKF
jgi:hypothetical protein